jgi:hypothetical protein
MISDWQLEKYCRYGPRNTRSPFCSVIEGWKSRVSIVIGETHSRCRVRPCSRLVFSSEYRITSKVTGSTLSLTLSCSLRVGQMLSRSPGMYPRWTPSQTISVVVVIVFPPGSAGLKRPR